MNSKSEEAIWIRIRNLKKQSEFEFEMKSQIKISAEEAAEEEEELKSAEFAEMNSKWKAK